MPKIHFKFILPALVLILVGYFFITHEPLTQISINDQTLKVELAQTFEEQRVGLMYRQELPEDQGMLFIYSTANQPTFWMKNTLIPLDMIFISSDKTINHIHQNVPPCPPELGNDCPSYGSSEPSQYILEVNGGYARENGLRVGDQLEFELH